MTPQHRSLTLTCGTSYDDSHNKVATIYSKIIQFLKSFHLLVKKTVACA